MSIEKSAKIILKDCMNLKKNESCLIITDSELSNIGHALYKNSLKIAKKSKIILIQIPKTHGTEPIQNVANEMLKYDVILMPTTKSLSHTKARKNATRKGARIASMPGITADMMKRTLNIDFYGIRKINQKLISMLKDKNKIRIITKKGTYITFYTKGRKWSNDDGIYIKKGAFGNLPSGEIFIAPLEGKTSGRIIVDASIGGLGKVDKNTEIKIKNGFIVNIKGGEVANQFKILLKPSRNKVSGKLKNRRFLSNKFYKSVAELGIGTNYKAKITGKVLEDEKVAGTCHIAFGNNKHFGGKVDVPFHLDVVIENPTIYAGNTLIMNNGKLFL